MACKPCCPGKSDLDEQIVQTDKPRAAPGVGDDFQHISSFQDPGSATAPPPPAPSPGTGEADVPPLTDEVAPARAEVVPDAGPADPAPAAEPASQPLQPSDKAPAPEAVRPESAMQYEISVDRSGGTKLGVKVDRQEDGALLIYKITGGLVGEWNALHPDRPVRPCDCIVEINGQRGPVSELAEECKKLAMLNMTLQRTKFRELQLDIDRSSGRKLGIKVHQQGEFLRINGITGDLFGDWNAQNPDQQVKVGDCIVEINGQTGASSLSEECRKNVRLNMTVIAGSADAS